MKGGDFLIHSAFTGFQGSPQRAVSPAAIGAKHLPAMSAHNFTPSEAGNFLGRQVERSNSKPAVNGKHPFRKGFKQRSVVKACHSHNSSDLSITAMLPAGDRKHLLDPLCNQRARVVPS
jgi:hypothetical protein